jgi:GTP cyclohydrolase I
MNKVIKSGLSLNRDLSVEERLNLIEKGSLILEEYLSILGFDFENDVNMKDTPRRIVKSHIDDLMSGCFSKPPVITAFDNIDKYDGMVFQGNIKLNSICSHHLLSFIGKAHVAYIPSPDGKVIGLSKLNRIVEYFARRPQVQENLTIQVHDYINRVCEGNLGVAVHLEANHLCACVRGVRHDSTMKTSKLSGAFKDKPEVREEFYFFIQKL